MYMKIDLRALGLETLIRAEGRPLTTLELAKRVGCSRGCAANLIKRLKKSTTIETKKIGKATVVFARSEGENHA